jgi:acetyltransferase-like isoleucine patch superfamily enzyme
VRHVLQVGAQPYRSAGGCPGERLPARGLHESLHDDITTRMKQLLRRLVRRYAFAHARGEWLYRRVCNPAGEEWAAYLKRHGHLYAIGEHCSIQQNVIMTDPKFVRLGNNVRLSGCTLFGHDGSVNMLNRAYGLKLDRVGKIDIRDNVFIGHGAIVLPGTTIGPNAIVAAGAVVTGDVAPHSVYAGVPARRICHIQDMVQGMAESCARYPWRALIEQRDGAMDPQLEPELTRQRLEHFFGPQDTGIHETDAGSLRRVAR